MRRRDLLAGSLLVVSGLGGCARAPADGGSDATTGTFESPTRTPSPSPTATSTVERANFDISDISCGGGAGDATLDVGDEFVRVEGVATGRNTCYRAELDGVRFEDGVMTVAVRTFSRPHTGETCGGCLVDIDYRVLVRYRGPLDGVVVRHDGAAVARREVG